MTEGILIEIAQRRRKLEDVLERADLHLAADIQRCQNRIEKAEYAHQLNPDYNLYTKRVNEPMADKSNLEDVRSDLETAADSCRDDMNAMAEFIRKVRG